MNQLTAVNSLVAKARAISGDRTHIKVYLNGELADERKSKRNVTHVTFRQSVHQDGRVIEHFTYHGSEKQANAVKNGTMFGEIISKEVNRTIAVVEW